MIASPSELRARLEAAVAVDAPVKPDRLTVETLFTLYLAHAEKAYNGRHGRKNLNTIRQSFEPMTLLYGAEHPDSIRSLQLRAVRQWWIERGNARTTIATRIQTLHRAWTWAAAVDLLTAELPRIEPVRFGHAPDSPKIGPVALELVEATLPHCSPIVGIMLKTMLLTGMRPGECCDMRGQDIDRSRPIWVYRPPLHKTRWTGKDRDIFIGPRAQLLLTPLLKPGPLFITRIGVPWSPPSLYNAVINACKAAGIGYWHPNQLRHAAATMLRRELGLDSAQAVLGHSRIETTQHYAARSEQLATAAALKFG